MFKRFSNQQLSIALGALAFLFLISNLFGGRPERSFRENLGLVDTTAISLIRINKSGQDPVELRRNDSGWTVQRSDGKSFPAVSSQVRAALGSLQNVNATQLVSTSKSKWSSYDVDTAGIKVEAFEGNSKKLDLIMGRFEYKQSGLMTYVRSGEEDNVYLVNGMLSSGLDKEADEWRNKKLLSGTTTEWNKLTFIYPADSSMQLVKVGNDWKLSDSTMLGASKVRSYLNRINNMNGEEFVEKEQAITAEPLFSLQIEGPVTPITISAHTDSQYGYLLSSSQNPGVYFNGDASELWEKIFVGIQEFYTAE